MFKCMNYVVERCNVCKNHLNIPFEYGAAVADGSKTGALKWGNWKRQKNLGHQKHENTHAIIRTHFVPAKWYGYKRAPDITQILNVSAYTGGPDNAGIPSFEFSREKIQKILKHVKNWRLFVCPHILCI